jgi:acyl carrier protein
MSVQLQVREFIERNFLLDGDGSRLTNTTSFLDSGIIDSTGVLELVSFLEETFGFEVQDEELVPANLDSIDNLIRYIDRKRNGGSEA